MSELPPSVVATIRPEVMKKRADELQKSGITESFSEKYTVVPESEYGLRLTKTLIGEIKALFTGNKLHVAFLSSSPKPLFTFFLVPNYSTSPTSPSVKGIPSEEDYLPRQLREKRRPTHRSVLGMNQKSNCVLNIIAQDEECMEEPGSGHGDSTDVPTNSLLAEGKLGWTSVGKDDYSLQLSPTISEFEEKLKELLDLPLTTLAECPSVAAVGSTPIRLHFYRSAYESVLLEAQEVAMYSLYGPLSMVGILRQYDYFLYEDQQQLLNQLIHSHIGDYPGLIKELLTITEDLETIQQHLPSHMQFGVIELNLSKYKSTVSKHGLRLTKCLLEELQSEYSGLLYQAAQLFDDIMNDLLRSPQTVEELQEINEYLKKGEDTEKFTVIGKILQQAGAIEHTLQTYNTHLTEKQLQKSWETKVWQTDLKATRTRTVVRINKAKPAFIEQVLSQSADLSQLLEDTELSIQRFEDYQDLKYTDEYAQTADSIMTTLRNAQKETVVLNNREKVLGIPETDYTDFENLAKSFGKFHSLWGFARDWLRASEEWNFNNFRLINGELVNQKYSEWSLLLSNLEVEFDGRPCPLAVVSELQGQMTAFQRYVSLIMELRHPALKDRHWDAILGLLKGHFDMATLNLHILMKADVLSHVEDIKRLCHVAVNEYEVERVLADIEAESSSFAFSLSHDSDFPDLLHISGMEAAESTIQEHLSTLSFLSSTSKYTSFFKSRIDKLRFLLNSASTTIRDIKELQNTWSQVYPLLELGEVRRSISRELYISDVKEFVTRQMEAIGSSQSVVVVTDTRVKTYVEAQTMVDAVTVDIEKVIKEKSQQFPRLLFLSMRELKAFLGEVARKGVVSMTVLYPGLGNVSLKDVEIREVSRGNFTVPLNKHVSLLDGQRDIPVESWLSDFDSCLRNAFQHSIMSLIHTAESSDEWWRNSDDPQILALTQHILFTTRVFASLNLEETLKESMQDLRNTLGQLITEVRPIFGTPGQSNLIMFKGENMIEQKLATRMKLEKLVLVVLNQLHTLNLAIERNAYDWEDLLWKTTFRLEPLPDSRPLEMNVTFFDLTKSFGFEWQPLPLPLFVSTPISERCMLNLVCALKHNENGLLQGGPGSSKRETLQELALLYGRSVLCLTMASGAHSTCVQSALIGSLATGAWLCLEEINLLDPMLLNFLVFSLPKICDAQRLGLREININDQSVRVHEGFACWALTTQSNLQLPLRFIECFRCVSLVQPDLAAVAEVRIYALGLSRARELSRRIARALTMLADDCSSLFRPATSRRFKATSLQVLHKVIDSMAVVLDNYTVTDDNYLLSNVLSRVLKVGLSSSEEALLDEYLTTIFRSPHNSILAGTALTNETVKFKEILSKQSLSDGEDFLRCMRALWTCVVDSDRRVILLAGPPASGKSTLINTTALAYSQFREVDFNMHFLSGQVSHLGLYRVIEACSSPNFALRCHCTSQSVGSPTTQFTEKDWIRVDTETIQSDSLLAIARNEVYLEDVVNVKVAKTLRVVVEVETMAGVAPSLLSDASSIYCAESDFTDESLFQHQLHTHIPHHESTLMTLYRRHYHVLSSLYEDSLLTLSHRVRVMLLVKWLLMLLGKRNTGSKLILKYRLEVGDREEEKMREVGLAEVEISWVLCLVACFGQISRNKAAFSECLMRLCKEENTTFAANLVQFLTKKRINSLFDVTYLFPQKTWTTWSDLSPSIPPASFIPQMPSSSHLFIETDSTKQFKFRIHSALKSHTDVLLIGPHQSGKTEIVMETLRKMLSEDMVFMLPVHILQSTLCDTVEHQVEETLEQYRPYTYGALGGTHHYVFIEDMNLDGNSIYDDLRFYKEYAGWYNKDDFHAISGLTLCLAHSYSAHRFRALNQRSIRHFLVLYKSQYSDTELQCIFSTLAESKVSKSLYAQYARMKLDLAKLERSWQHSTLSNYVFALRWVRAHGCAENMLRKYFGDQQLCTPPERYFIPGELLEGNLSGYHPISPAVCHDLNSTFQRIRSRSNEKYAEFLKYFKEPLANPIEQKARQLYHFCQIVDDLQFSQNSITIVERELKTVRALMYMAAEYAGMKVVPVNLADFSSDMVNSIAAGQSNYLATDIKFALKLMLDEAANKDKRQMCLIMVDEDTNCSLPVISNLFEFCSDVSLGKATKSISPYPQKPTDLLYPSQFQQIIRERMQRNVIFTLLLRTDIYSFDRNRKIGPLEYIKHNFRSLFNTCRICCYEKQPIPVDLMENIQQITSENADLMKDLALVTAKPLEEFALEQIWYLYEAICRFDKEKFTKKLDLYRKGVAKLTSFEQEIEKSNYIIELQTKAENLRSQLQSSLIEKDSLLTDEKDDFQSLKSLKSQIEQEKLQMKSQIESCEAAVLRELSQLPSRKGLTQPREGNLVLLGALQFILFPKSKPFPFNQPEKYQLHCKQIVMKMTSSLQEIIAKLHNIDSEQYPDLSDFLRAYTSLQQPSSPLEDLVVALEQLRVCLSQYKLKQNEWLEAPLRLQSELTLHAQTRSQLVTERLQSLQQTIAALETDIKEIEEKLQEAAARKPTLVLVSGELKEIRDEWEKHLQIIQKHIDCIQGNALLKSVFFVASLNSDLNVRETVRKHTESVLKSREIQFESGSDSESPQDPSISAFLHDSVKGSDLVWQLGLPYPVFIDPFLLAAEILPVPTVVFRYSAEIRKDSQFVMCVKQGQAVLLVEPTEGMVQSIMPLLQFRYSNSIKAMRGDEKNPKFVRLGMINIEVNPEFRLYISLAGKPSITIAQISTVISLEPSDPASWRTSILVRLSKIHSVLIEDKAEIGRNREIVVRMVRDETVVSVYSAGFQEMLKLLERKRKARKTRRSSSGSEDSSEDGQLQDTYLELLAIAGDLSSVLQTLKLGEWSISPQIFRTLLLSACEEQIRKQGFPSVEQIAMFTGPILYRFLVRLLWLLPAKGQNSILLSYCLKRHCEEGLFSRTIRAISMGLSLPFTRNTEELASRWDTLKTWFALPAHLHFRAPELVNFHCKDLFSEASLPESLDIRTQAVLYSWFRQDLLPLYIETLVVQALGRRFSYLPDVDYAMAAQFITNSTPLVVFFKKTYPIPWLTRAAQVHQVELVHLLPVVLGKVKFEARLERLLHELDTATGARKWVVMEGLECLNRSEVERLEKHFFEYIHRPNTEENFRLWIIFETSPAELTAWTGFLKTAYRLAFRDPKTVREHMIVSQELFDEANFDVVSSRKRQMYEEYSQIELPMLRRMDKRVTRINPVLRASMTKQLRNEGHRPSTLAMNIANYRRTSTRNGSLGNSGASIYSSEGTDSINSLTDFYCYNLTLVTCALHLRQRYCRDLPTVLSLKDMRITIKEAMIARLSDSLNSDETENSRNVALLFLQVIGASWDENGFYAGLNFVKHALLADSKSLKFEFTDDSGSWSEIQYPLYKLRGGNMQKIEGLLFEMPKEDHLQLIGQPHLLARKRYHRQSARIGTSLPSVESLMDLQPIPIFQKVSDIITLLKSLLLTAKEETAVNPETLKIGLTAEESKRYSYFFVPDRYRAADYYTCFLKNPTSFSEILSNLEELNVRNYDYFFRSVVVELERILGYLDYSTAQISSEDTQTLSQLRNDKTPSRWLKSGPYSLHYESKCSNYISLLHSPSTQFNRLIDFSEVFNPAGLLTALLRSLAFRVKCDVEHAEFEIREYDEGTPVTEEQFLVSGLWLFNATMKNQVIQESYNSPPTKLPVFLCSVVKKHKNIDVASVNLPPGIFLFFHRTTTERLNTEVTKDEHLSSTVMSAFRYQRTDWLDLTKREAVPKPLDRYNKVLCPVFPKHSTTKIWMVLHSGKPQDHWSKRGVKVDLP